MNRPKQSLTMDRLPTDLQQTITHQTLSAGQILFQQGEAARSVFFVESGQMRLVTFTDKQTITYSLVETGQSFMETALFEAAYTCTAMADMPSRVAIIPKQTLLQALHDSTALTDLYLQQLSHRFSHLKHLVTLRSIRSARERLLYYLMSQVQSDGKTVILERSLKDLASEVGLAPDVVSRVLMQLQEESVISRQKGKITFR